MVDKGYWLSSRFFVGVLTLALSLCAMGCPGDLVVTFADPGLEGAVRAELGYPVGLLHQSDLLKLRTLDARNLDIRDLSGLEFARNLFALDVSGNNIADVGVLENLPHLTKVTLEENPIASQ